MRYIYNMFKRTCISLGQGVTKSDLFNSMVDMACDIGRFIINNLYNMYLLMQFACPYIMLFVGVYLYEIRGAFTIGYEFFIPICLFVISSLIHRYANRKNKGDSIPVPRKRFTEVNEDGYSIDQSDVSEIILYLGEVEDYLERKRLL